MKLAALASLAAALSFALPAASLAQSYDQKVGGTTSIQPHEQQAQIGAKNDHDHDCAGLKQRSKELWDQADRSKDHGDFASARDQLDTINQQLTRDCGK